jgi:CRISPR-associated protein Cmr3
MQVAIRPVDVWLFRDGKPFTAGEDHVAESNFPPSPFTLQGAIRTKVLVDKGTSLPEFAREGKPDPQVGYGDYYGALRLWGPLLARLQDSGWERLLPIPADVVGARDRYELLRPGPDLTFVTNLPSDLALLWARMDERMTEAKGWLPEGEWARYLRGLPPQQVVRSDEAFFTFEPRCGIAMDIDKGMAQEAMLYQARFVRLRDGVALWADVDGVPISEKGFLRFGGEGRAAIYEAIQNTCRPLWDFRAASGAKRFKAVLVTPAWFSDGWQPKDGDWSKLFGSAIRLVGAAIPRPLHLGGFDVAKGAPKPMRAFVPSGAVYFFEADEPIQLPNEFAFTETPDEVRRQNAGANAWARIGLGAALIGLW